VFYEEEQYVVKGDYQISERHNLCGSVNVQHNPLFNLFDSFDDTGFGDLEFGKPAEKVIRVGDTDRPRKEAIHQTYS